MSHEGVGAWRLKSFFRQARRFVIFRNGQASGTDGVLGHAMPGTLGRITQPTGRVLILMGDWCVSGHGGDTESNEDPGAKQEPQAERERRAEGWKKEKHKQEEWCAHLTEPANG